MGISDKYLLQEPQQALISTSKHIIAEIHEETTF